MSDEVDMKWFDDTWERVVNLAVDESLKETAIDITNAAIRNAPVFVGNLRRSIGHTGPSTESGLRVAWVGFRGGRKDAFRYAMAVEKGRRPGKPPPSEALMLWVERKLHVGQTQSKTTGKWRKTTTKASKAVSDKTGMTRRETEIRNVAFLIARSIGRKGTQPHPFMLPAYDEQAQGTKSVGARLQRKMESLQGLLPN